MFLVGQLKMIHVKLFSAKNLLIEIQLKNFQFSCWLKMKMNVNCCWKYFPILFYISKRIVNKLKPNVKKMIFFPMKWWDELRRERREYSLIRFNVCVNGIMYKCMRDFSQKKNKILNFFFFINISLLVFLIFSFLLNAFHFTLGECVVVVRQNAKNFSFVSTKLERSNSPHPLRSAFFTDT